MFILKLKRCKSTLFMRKYLYLNMFFYEVPSKNNTVSQFTTAKFNRKKAEPHFMLSICKNCILYRLG